MPAPCHVGGLKESVTAHKFWTTIQDYLVQCQALINENRVGRALAEEKMAATAMCKKWKVRCSLTEEVLEQSCNVAGEIAASSTKHAFANLTTLSIIPLAPPTYTNMIQDAK